MIKLKRMRSLSRNGEGTRQTIVLKDFGVNVLVDNPDPEDYRRDPTEALPVNMVWICLDNTQLGLQVCELNHKNKCIQENGHSDSLFLETVQTLVSSTTAATHTTKLRKFHPTMYPDFLDPA